jgi:N-acetylglucosamine transport system permease protein
MKRRETIATRKKQWYGFITLMSLPALLIYTVFRFLPSLVGFGFSLFNWRGTSLHMTFIGLNNYKALIHDDIFWKTLGNHLYLFVCNTIIVFVLAIILAVMLTGKSFKERGIYRVLFFFPTVVPAVIINVVWISVFNPNIGLLNGLLQIFGIQGGNWLGNEALVKNTILFVMIWISLGFYMVFFMAAFLNIPSSLFESARIDGCGPVRQMITIAIPLMWEQIRTALIFFIVTSCGVGFNVVFMMTKGGPHRSSEILTTYMYQQSFGGQSKFGYASAVAVVILLVTTVLALLILRLTRRETFEM